MAGPETLAQGYVYNETSSTYHPVPYMNLTTVSGAGSVISNVIDYTKWLRCLLTSSAPLSPAGHASLKKPRILHDPMPEMPFTGTLAYSLGWNNGVYKGYEFWEHTGGMEAFAAEVIFFPGLGEGGYGVVGFGNTAVTSNYVEKALVFKLIDDKIGLAEKERYDWNKV